MKANINLLLTLTSQIESIHQLILVNGLFDMPSYCNLPKYWNNNLISNTYRAMLYRKILNNYV